MLTILGMATAGLLLIVVVLLLIYSPGKLKPYLDNDGKEVKGSIAEKIFLPVGGVQQGMFIKSKHINNPVLLYVHGGPAFPNYFLIDKYDPGLEDYFTVCYWEQRGGGLSYSSAVSVESMTLDQLATDAIELTNYLRKRFAKEKIFMMAHSGGTAFALLAASRKPELYHAYIAMAQITDQAASEKTAYKYMLAQYSNTGNQKRINQLKKYESNIHLFYRSAIRDQSMHELGIGTMHKMNSVFWDIFIPVWACRAYTLQEKINIWRSKFLFLPKTNLVNEMLGTNFNALVSTLDIPVYFFSGKHDLTVNIDLAKGFLVNLQAPMKGFYTFNNSAHSPLFEEPLLVRRILEKDVLHFRNSLAD